jgi:hypothetical protein
MAEAADNLAAQKLMELQTDDAMGHVDPKTSVDLLGKRSLGDDAAADEDGPKIVDVVPGALSDD